MKIAKPTKVTNKKLVLDVINQLQEETEFHFTDIKFSDTYFVIGGPKDSICHFHIKEIPGFLFAFWNTNRFDKIEEQLKNNHTLWSDYFEICSKSELVFFTQYERDIDKFKPSYSGFVQGIYRDAWYELNDDKKKIKKEEWYLADIPEILAYMHKHPIKSYIYVNWGNPKAYCTISGFKALQIFTMDALDYHNDIIKNRIHKRHLIKASKKFVKKLKTMDYIIELEQSSKPRINIRLAVRNYVSLEDYKKDVSIIDKFENKYFDDIDISCWFEDISSSDSLTHEKIESNKDLNRRFHEYASMVLSTLKKDPREQKDILDEYLIEKIIDMKISKEED